MTMLAMYLITLVVIACYIVAIVVLDIFLAERVLILDNGLHYISMAVLVLLETFLPTLAMYIIFN